jgi:cytoskeletal protein RodZ
MAGTSLSARRDYGQLGLAFRRQEKKISLEQISEATKIGVRALEFIEAEDFRNCQAVSTTPVTFGQYAKAIDSDESEILAVYYSVMGINPRAEEKAERKPVSSSRFHEPIFALHFRRLGS